MRYGQRDEQKLLYASRMAVTLGHLVVEQMDKVSLSTFDDEPRESLAPSNTMAQIIQMTKALDAVKPERKTAIGPAVLELAARAGRRGVVVILSDFLVDLDDLEAALQRLRYEKHEVVLMQVLHHDELAFELDGLVRFVGLEDEERTLARPEDVREEYLEAFGRFSRRLEDVCESNRCELLVCDTSRPMGELFADYLQQRSRVRRRW
jgi:uncharacterized protein (DUF58 family)